MSGKRSRKVAFKDDVDNLDIEDKKRKELENDRNSEKRSIKMMVGLWEGVVDHTQSSQYLFFSESRFKEKHSLDSDEEDEIDEIKEGGLDDEDLGAQEETTIFNDGEIKVTPFNLEQEMEEGYFDKHGNYFEKKDLNEIRDSWLDDVDWIKIEELNEWKKGEKKPEQDEEEQDDTPLDKIIIYQQIIDILKPGETLVKVYVEIH
jgi:CD2 antigen cytoplasmic tail-binding protein 2